MLTDKRIPFKYIFKQIRADVARVFFFSVSFQLLEWFFAKYIPLVPGLLPTILGSAISLILAFKINQSYDRWWEARKVWGAIVNDSRSLVLQLKGFLEDDLLGYDAAQEVIRKIGNRQIAWCYSLGQSLRGLNPMANLEHYVSADELAYLRKHNNKPLALLALHTEDFKVLRRQDALHSFEHVQLDNTLVRLCDSMGKAERINSTVFPVTYRMFIHLFIYLFLIVLSLALVETIGLLELPILLVFASSFFLLEKTATYLQDPFRNRPTDTPVTAIARTIEINIKQLLDEQEVPKPSVPEAFYLM
ncbi:bestrophin family ion channel [Hymenobacter sp. YC55]|uniref:bestrophin family protein n=1 Tax=Hymenobacter sp. YC55 TaxID=3034019 RepID=UPI0023F8D0CD|nr:bestrophin family ion channel [Hymenobacter sp. YC55]MDF7812776.1 bestrophin family ion channel [Hymenobacter sp. YC55]